MQKLPLKCLSAYTIQTIKSSCDVFVMPCPKKNELSQSAIIRDGSVSFWDIQENKTLKAF